ATSSGAALIRASTTYLSRRMAARSVLHDVPAPLRQSHLRMSTRASQEMGQAAWDMAHREAGGVMPMSPKRPCTVPLCRNLQPCAVHPRHKRLAGQSYAERKVREPWRNWYQSAQW